MVNYEDDSTDVKKGRSYTKTVRGVRPSSESGPYAVRKNSKKLLIRPLLSTEEKILFAKVPENRRGIAVCLYGKTLRVVEGELTDMHIFYELYFEKKNLERLRGIKKNIGVYREKLDQYNLNKDLVVIGRGGERSLVPNGIVDALPRLRADANALELKVETAIKALDGNSVSGERLFSVGSRNVPKPRCYGAVENDLNSKEAD